MKNILVVHTGGTISMKEDHDAKTVSLSKENPLSNSQSILPNEANIITVLPFNLPSAHISTEKMIILKEVIEENINKHVVDGIVITHGTDTLEETAFFLHTTLDTSIPVVITGAMRSSNEISADGLHNFISAIRVALSDEAKDKGVLVVLNDEIHLAEYVTKTHTSNVATFQSPQCGPIGIVTKENCFFYYKAKQRTIIPVNQINKRVALLKAYAGMENDILEAMIELKYDGVVIEALGQGNVSPATLEGIRKLIQHQIPIVLVSRSLNGVPAPNYDYIGGGKGLKDLGVIFANGINGQKARLQLAIGLSAGISVNKLFSK